uniref:NADH-ubiquinone oxidoreductase chain 3 n=1 Tax=Thampoa tiani TaxID=2893150 RepID=A0A9E7BY60_9HEMI|nr:NADH dehydrogenase subunit 3 [Thampoa tiani]UGN61387.1 NADH dehydrogenase subunit 3 [Thampoa tiani]
MNTSLKHLMVVSLIMIMMMMLMLILSKKETSQWQKSTPFECGFNPMSFKRLPFSIHFFLVATIFLIFDIEIIIILPMMLTLKTSLLKIWMTTSIMFIIILIVGLYHEWINGMLDWAS